MCAEDTCRDFHRIFPCRLKASDMHVLSGCSRSIRHRKLTLTCLASVAPSLAQFTCTTANLPTHCTINRAERLFNEGSNSDATLTTPLPSMFDKSKIVVCAPPRIDRGNLFRAAGREREPLRGNTRHVLDAQGAGSPQATRKRRLASCYCGWVCLAACLAGKDPS